jgi:hypothetical protein
LTAVRRTPSKGLCGRRSLLRSPCLLAPPPNVLLFNCPLIGLTVWASERPEVSPREENNKKNPRTAPTSPNPVSGRKSQLPPRSPVIREESSKPATAQKKRSENTLSNAQWVPPDLLLSSGLASGSLPRNQGYQSDWM